MAAKISYSKRENAPILCPECKRKCYLNQFDFTFCELCGAPVVSEHRPPYLLCPACANKEGRCEQCGKPLEGTVV